MNEAQEVGEHSLKRSLGPWNLVALGIGAIIGAGLFVRTAAAIADRSLGLARVGKGAKAQLAPGEKYLKIISAFRSREYQEQLRRESPSAGSAGLAVNSPHFTGRALDLYVGGDPVDTTDSNRAIQVQTRVYKWLVRNAERFGFRPYFYEPWHWEYSQ